MGMYDACWTDNECAVPWKIAKDVVGIILYFVMGIFYLASSSRYGTLWHTTMAANEDQELQSGYNGKENPKNIDIVG